MTEQDEEGALVAASRAGSAEAFSRIVLDHQGAVRAYIAHFVRGWDLVDDLAQETFLGAFKGLAGYQADAPLRLWLLGVARRRVLAYLREELRRRGRAARLEKELQALLTESAEADETPDHLAARDRRATSLSACVEDLRDANAQLFAGFYIAREPVAVLARRLGRSEGAVKVALFRLRQALRACVERRLTPDAESA